MSEGRPRPPEPEDPRGPRPSPAVLCPLCDGTSRRRFAKHDWWIRDCEACGHRFAEHDLRSDHVARVYGDDYFAGGGAGYPGYLDEGPLLRDAGLSYARMLGRHMRPGTVLDIGSAAGFWLQGLVDAGWVGRGIEPNAAMAEHGRSRLGLAVAAGTIEDLPDDGERFDLVTMIQVVAHFVDVRRALEAAVERTRPGGWLLVETWDRESWTARCLGRRWHEYSPPSVLHWFSRGSLSRLGESLGLRERARGRPQRRISAAHARSLLRHSGSPHGPARWVARALDHLPASFALPYPGDDAFWMLLQRVDGSAEAPARSTIR